VSAALVAGAVCLEPVAEGAVGRLPQQSTVWIIEVSAGLVLASYFVLARSGFQRAIARNVNADN